MKPATQYTKSGSINIAYQVFGSGKMDLVYIPGWVSNIDLMWACPELVAFLLELGKIARVVLFDKRGTGLSDRLVEFSTLEERMDDIRAVMDAVHSEKAVLFGHSEGGSVSALFAATYPERTLGMMCFGIFAKRKYSEDYPWAPTEGERQAVYEMIENSWGSGDMNLESLAPSMASDKMFMEWLANYFRSGASPSAAMTLTKMNTQVDIIDILSSIRVPTLIIQRKDDIDVKVEEGRFIAKRIVDAKLVELEGDDHLFWVGNTDEVLNHMEKFMNELEPEKIHDERLFTVISGKVKPGEGANRLEGLVKEIIKRGTGQYTSFRGDTFIAAFDGPSKAINCGLDLVSFLKSLTMDVAIAIDMMEGVVVEDQLVNLNNQGFIEELLRESKPGQLLATQAVKYLLAGADISFISCGGIVFKGTSERTELFWVVDTNELPDASISILRDQAFFDQTIQIIRDNYINDVFGIEQLANEMCLSERQLQRKVKAVTNKSPGQLIQSVRLQEAKRLLEAGTNSISEVAYLTGFGNPSYFAKSFKREFGKSPSSINSQQ